MFMYCRSALLQALQELIDDAVVVVRGISGQITLGDLDSPSIQFMLL